MYSRYVYMYVCTCISKNFINPHTKIEMIQEGYKFSNVEPGINNFLQNLLFITFLSYNVLHITVKDFATFEK